MYARVGEEEFALRDTDLKPRMQENAGGGGGGAGGGRARIEGLREGEKGRNIKYARTDAWSHSSLPFLPLSLFPILVPSKRFLLSPFSSSYNRLSPCQSLSLSSCLCPRCFLLIVRFSRLSPSRSPLDRPFFFPLFRVIIVSTVACRDTYSLS